MKRLLTIILCCILSVAGVSVMADSTATFDFTRLSYGLPTDRDITVSTATNMGVSITFEKTSGSNRMYYAAGGVVLPPGEAKLIFSNKYFTKIHIYTSDGPLNTIPGDPTSRKLTTYVNNGGTHNIAITKIVAEYGLGPGDVFREESANYKINEDGSVCLYAVDTDVKTFSIPEYIIDSDNVKRIVTGIYGGAFLENKNLVDVSIPETIVYIGNRAFRNCSKLEVAYIPNSVKELGDACFENCTSLARVELPSNLTIIPNHCFSQCSNLKEISIPNSVVEISENCFEGCSSLSSVKLPNGIKKISDYAFNDCTNITVINLPNSIETFGEYCFADCKSLNNITIPTKLPKSQTEFFQAVLTYLK